MKQERLLPIDLIKVVAMCAVMCLHTQYAYYNEISTLAHFLYISAVVAIPLFFMTSGYLLLGRSNIDYKYAGKKIFGILRFVAIISVAWYAVFSYRHHIGFLGTTVGSLFQKGGMWVFWYFGAMIIIYALLPWINRLYTGHFKSFAYFVAAMFVTATIVFVLNISNDIHIEQHTIQTFRLWNWLLYFCIGGILRKRNFRVSWLAVIALFAINYLFQIQMQPFIDSMSCEFFYPSIPVMVLSIALFVKLKSINSRYLIFVNEGGVRFSCLATPFISRL